MRDEAFDYFISKFGEATQTAPVPSASIEKWRGKLPAKLLEYWQNEGWCAYADGLFWTVDPEDYEDLVEEWLEDSPLEEIDTFHVVARSAFGDLLLCGEKCGGGVTVHCSLNAVMGLSKELVPKTEERRDRSIQVLFGFSKLANFDKNDEARRPLFARAVKKLGPLAVDEMYAFEPALVAGGRMRLQNLRRVKLDQHLTILRQLAAPTMEFQSVDIEKLLGN